MLTEEAKSKRKRAYEKQVRMSSLPIQKTLEDFGFAFQLPIDKRQVEELATVFTSNKTFSQWNEVFADVTIASAILDRVLHHCLVIHIEGESYRLKERKEFMKQKQQIVNTLFEQSAQ